MDLHAALTHATDQLMCAARTLAYWVSDDDDLPDGVEMPSEESAQQAVDEARQAISNIQFARLEMAGQMALFTDCGKMREALIELRDRIKDHPAYAELTIDREIEVGGDTAELSYLARVADDALHPNDKG